MSSLLLEDTELDIEAELTGDGKSHALPYCAKHKGAEFFPAPGSIVQAICGKLIRIRQYLARPAEHKRCEKCAHFQGKILHCEYCGAEVVG